MWNSFPGAPPLRIQVLAEFATCATVAGCLQGACRVAEVALPVLAEVKPLRVKPAGPRRIVA